MTITDPIADMLTRLRNAAMIKEEIVDIPASNLKIAIMKKLLDEGFIHKYEVLTKGNKKNIRVALKYDKSKKSVISFLGRRSKPGRRVYTKSTKVPRVLGGFGCAILSTNQGILTDREARKMKVGGEVLCYIW